MKRNIALVILTTVLMAVPMLASAQTAPVDIAKGAIIWKDNCMRCHNARSSMERLDRDWETIVGHMRARANLTKTEARAILTFLQATNAPEPSAYSPAAPSQPVQSSTTKGTSPKPSEDSQKTGRSS